VNRQEEPAVRRLVCLQATGVAAAYVLAVAVVDLFYVRRHIADSGMAFGYAFCLVQAGLIALLLLSSMAIKFFRKRRDLRWERARPLITTKACEYLSGSARLAELEAIRRRDPDSLERGIAELLLRVHGAARKRLSDLAARLGLVDLWIARYRSRFRGRRAEAIRLLALLDCRAANGTLVEALADEDDEIKLEASRALVRGAGPREIKEVFRTAVRESLLVRAVLVEALRPHAALLCRIALPEALADPDEKVVRTALQIVRAWGKALPLAGLVPPLHHPDPRIRSAALAILPQFPDKFEFAGSIRLALSDSDDRVRTAAAATAGRLRLSAVAPDLERCLETSGPDACLAAAYAIAHLGRDAWPRLDGQIRKSRSTAAAAALEALERARSGRLLLGTP